MSDAFVSALEIDAPAQMAMLAALTPYVDAGISKTVNLPRASTPADIRALYFDAWRAGLKSLSTFRAGSARAGILSADRDGAGDAAGAEDATAAACGLNAGYERGFCRSPGQAARIARTSQAL